MIRPRSAAAFGLLLLVYVTTVLVTSVVFPLLWGGFAFCMSFVIIPFFCMCLFAFYCGALCLYLGYALDARAPMLRVAPVALAMTILAIPAAYRLSVYWGGPDVFNSIRSHGR
jgi:hypothetical protein